MNAPRYSILPGADNTYSVPHKETFSQAYAATYKVDAQSPKTEKILVDFTLLTGALSVTADQIQPSTGDKLVMQFKADGTNRVVTLSTGFISAGTITVLANKTANIEFIASAEMNAWVEKKQVRTILNKKNIMANKFKSPVTQALKDTLVENERIAKVHFTAKGGHYFDVYEPESNDYKGKKFGFIATHNIIIDGQKIRQETPMLNTLIVESIDREDILSAEVAGEINVKSLTPEETDFILKNRELESKKDAK